MCIRDRVETVVVGQRADLTSVARGLYAALRRFDDTEVQIIVAECFDEDDAQQQDAAGAEGIAEAIMNRLSKAAAARITGQQPQPAPVRS